MTSHAAVWTRMKENEDEKDKNKTAEVTMAPGMYEIEEMPPNLGLHVP